MNQPKQISGMFVFLKNKKENLIKISRTQELHFFSNENCFASFKYREKDYINRGPMFCGCSNFLISFYIH